MNLCALVKMIIMTTLMETPTYKKTHLMHWKNLNSRNLIHGKWHFIFHLSRPPILYQSGSLLITITSCRHQYNLILLEDQLGKAKYTLLRSQRTQCIHANTAIRSSHLEWVFITIQQYILETINTLVLFVTRNL